MALTGKLARFYAAGVGDSPVEIARTMMWTMSQEPDTEEYADSDSGCVKAVSVGAIKKSGEVKVRVAASGATKGKAVLEVGLNYDVQFHIDDSGDNYYSTTAIITGITGDDYDLASATPIAHTYTWQALTEVVGNGTLA
jgi:hypothetical protein